MIEPRQRGLLAFFAPAPPMPISVTDPREVQARYKHWQRKVLITTIIGYAMFYFVRKNLSIAMPVMEKSLGISKTQLGIFLTLHGVLYGVSKFANGFLGDRANARAFMVAGLLLSALANVIFGFSSAVVVFGLVWMANGWFQGIGFPPCARLMTHWFSPRELATKMSIWNTSHSIGAGLGMLVKHCGWNYGFLGMLIAAAIGAGLFLMAWSAAAHGYAKD
jgi:OPA family glycerol-3-phosphate transporter-like MFS transporter/OPA family sugar phosphate sensor protein UhpC-like MFS transporter